MNTKPETQMRKLEDFDEDMTHRFCAAAQLWEDARREDRKRERQQRRGVSPEATELCLVA
jgi:hypothetical protein